MAQKSWPSGAPEPRGGGLQRGKSRHHREVDAPPRCFRRALEKLEDQARPGHRCRHRRTRPAQRSCPRPARSSASRARAVFVAERAFVERLARATPARGDRDRAASPTMSLAAASAASASCVRQSSVARADADDRETRHARGRSCSHRADAARARWRRWRWPSAAFATTSAPSRPTAASAAPSATP